jgi:hypothetical protein
MGYTIRKLSEVSVKPLRSSQYDELKKLVGSMGQDECVTCEWSEQEHGNEDLQRKRKNAIKQALGKGYSVIRTADGIVVRRQKAEENTGSTPVAG